MSKGFRGWFVSGIALVLVLLAGGGQNGYGQALTVTASASNATPNPALTNETVSATLSATVANPPTSNGYYCPVSAPLWSWSFGSVLLNGVPAQVPFQLTINQPLSNSANASLRPIFPRVDRGR